MTYKVMVDGEIVKVTMLREYAEALAPRYSVLHDEVLIAYELPVIPHGTECGYLNRGGLSDKPIKW